MLILNTLPVYGYFQELQTYISTPGNPYRRPLLGVWALVVAFVIPLCIFGITGINLETKHSVIISLCGLVLCLLLLFRTFYRYFRS